MIYVTTYFPLHTHTFCQSIRLTILASTRVSYTVLQDISSYNEMQTLEEAQEESGWKLVHGDVFRPPTTSPMLLSVMAGEYRTVYYMSYYTICLVSSWRYLITAYTILCCYFRLWSADPRHDHMHHGLRSLRPDLSF